MDQLTWDVRHISRVDVFFLTWLNHWKDQDIMRDLTFLELIPVVIAIELWGHDLQNKKVLFRVDNLSLVSVISSFQKKKQVMELVRHFVYRLMLHNVLFKAKHIASIDNNIADSLSRKQWQQFRKLAPMANTFPAPIPRQLVSMMYNFK